jgi:MFS family permease
MQKNNKRVLFLISLGAILEYYDFAIFIYLAPVIGKSLIPVQDKMTNMILSFAIFAIGAFFRPLGGLIFSHIGDIHGRSRTFIYTILLMAVPTLCIAFIPNINQIGIWATIILIIFRILQGISLGGEIPGSIVFGYEVSEPKYKALNSSVVVMGTNIGFFVASVVCMILAAVDFTEFASWRIAFILGGVFGFFSYFLRKSLTETPAFIEYKKVMVCDHVPFKQLIRHHLKPIVQVLGIAIFLASSLAVFTFYLPTYLSTFYNFPLAILMKFNSYTIIIFVIGSLIAGIYHKYFGKEFFIGFILIFMVFVIWLFFSYPYLQLKSILFIHAIALLMIGIVCGRLPVLAATFFPVEVRYTGVALVYNISFGIIAGSTQMLLTWLINITGLLWIPALYLAIFSILALCSLLTINRTTLINYRP